MNQVPKKMMTQHFSGLKDTRPRNEIVMLAGLKVHARKTLKLTSYCHLGLRKH